MRNVFVTLLFFILTFDIYNVTFAHPGNTASDGCHYCRTNCDRWGVPWNARHCHGGYSAPVTRAYTEPSCPANASYDSVSKGCVCNTGYATSLNKSYCVKIPANAHVVSSTTDVWECDYGYSESGDICIKNQQRTTIDNGKKEIPTPAQKNNGIRSSTNNDGGYGYTILGAGVVGLVSYLIGKLSPKK